MRNLEGKFLINKVATLPHSEIKPKIEKNMSVLMLTILSQQFKCSLIFRH